MRYFGSIEDKILRNISSISYYEPLKYEKILLIQIAQIFVHLFYYVIGTIFTMHKFLLQETKMGRNFQDYVIFAFSGIN